MDIIKITCVTCHASLSVRNRELIGQIVACPRCESMVEVVLPTTGSSEESTPLAAAATVTPSRFEPPTEPTEIPLQEAWQPEAALLRYKIVAWSLASFVVGASLVGALLLRSGDSRIESSSSAATVTDQLPQQLTTQEPKELPVVGPTVVELIVEPREVALSALPAKDEVHPAPEEVKTQAEGVVAVSPDKVGVEPVPASSVARRFDPLDLDPSAIDLATLQKTDIRTPMSPTDSVSPAEVEPPSVPVASEVHSTARSVRRNHETTSDAENRDAATQLTQKFPALKFHALPLVDFLDAISQLSGVPVSIAPEELLMAGITPRKEVSFIGKEVTLAEVLSQVFASSRLEYRTEGSHVIVVRKQGDQTRQIDYPLDDLLSAGCSMEEIANWVEQFVAPRSWQSAGGEGSLEPRSTTLHVSQLQPIQYQLLMFVERLRLARDLTPRSRFPIQQLAGKPAYEVVADRLSARSTFTFSQFTPLRDVIRHWQGELDVPLLVDWPALADEDIWPETEVAGAIVNQPWNKALDDMLNPLGISWRAAVGGVIEITTDEKVYDQPVLELFPLQIELSEAEHLMGKLKELAAEHATQTCRLHFNIGGNVLFSLHPAATQRRITQWLIEQELLRQ